MKSQSNTANTQIIESILQEFSPALELLNQYDLEKLPTPKTTKEELFKITYEEAVQAIQSLKKTLQGSDLFGNEKDKSFQSSLSTIYQTFQGKPLYPSIEEKAANLLYFIVKNHSFSDGNKRIAAFIFVWFLDRNRILYDENGTKLIDNNTLVATTLLIAESDIEQKENIVKLIVNLLTR